MSKIIKGCCASSCKECFSCSRRRKGSEDWGLLSDKIREYTVSMTKQNKDFSSFQENSIDGLENKLSELRQLHSQIKGRVQSRYSILNEQKVENNVQLPYAIQLLQQDYPQPDGDSLLEEIEVVLEKRATLNIEFNGLLNDLVRVIEIEKNQVKCSHLPKVS